MSLYSKQKQADGKLDPAEVAAISKEIEQLEARQKELDDREAAVIAREAQAAELTDVVEALTRQKHELERATAEWTDKTKFQPKLPGNEENNERGARSSAPGARFRAIAQDAARDMATDQLRRQVRQLEAYVTELKKKLQLSESDTAAERRRALELLEAAEKNEGLKQRAAALAKRVDEADGKAEAKAREAAGERARAKKAEAAVEDAAATVAAALEAEKAARAELEMLRSQLEETATDGSRNVGSGHLAVALEAAERAAREAEARAAKVADDAAVRIARTEGEAAAARDSRDVANAAADAAERRATAAEAAAASSDAKCVAATAASARAAAERDEARAALEGAGISGAAAATENSRKLVAAEARAEVACTALRDLSEAVALERDALAFACADPAHAAQTSLADVKRATHQGVEALMADVRAAFAAATVDVQCLRAEAEEVRAEIREVVAMADALRGANDKIMRLRALLTAKDEETIRVKAEKDKARRLVSRWKDAAKQWEEEANDQTARCEDALESIALLEVQAVAQCKKCHQNKSNAEAVEAELLLARRAKDTAEEELVIARRELVACDKRRRHAEEDAKVLQCAVEQERLDFRDAVNQVKELTQENDRVVAENELVKDELVMLRKRMRQIMRGAKHEVSRAAVETEAFVERARVAEEASAHAAAEAGVLKGMMGTLQIELRRLQQMNAQLRKRLKTTEHHLACAQQQQQQGRAPSSISDRPPTSATHVTSVSSYRG